MLYVWKRGSYIYLPVFNLLDRSRNDGYDSDTDPDWRVLHYFVPSFILSTVCHISNWVADLIFEGENDGLVEVRAATERA